ncbi:MAG TPA: hypothetical protein VMV69_18410 [Pirellulales bacterium]|nr:hypothetical protein [Pirellulales bacterium]
MAPRPQADDRARPVAVADIVDGVLREADDARLVETWLWLLRVCGWEPRPLHGGTLVESMAAPRSDGGLDVDRSTAYRRLCGLRDARLCVALDGATLLVELPGAVADRVASVRLDPPADAGGVGGGADCAAVGAHGDGMGMGDGNALALHGSMAMDPFESASALPSPIPMEADGAQKIARRPPEATAAGIASVGEPAQVIAQRLAAAELADPSTARRALAAHVQAELAAAGDTGTAASWVATIVDAVIAMGPPGKKSLNESLDILREKHAAGEITKTPGAFLTGCLRFRGVHLPAAKARGPPK